MDTEPKTVLEVFGQFLMEEFRDRTVGFYDQLATGGWNAPALQPLSRDLQSLGESQRAIIRRCLIEAIDSGLHDFLFALQERRSASANIKVLVNGINVAEVSDGLNGELFAEDGWIAKFSRYEEAESTTRIQAASEGFFTGQTDA